MNYHRLTVEQIRQVKEKYPEGTRVCLDYMDDNRPIEPGTLGTVVIVDDFGTIHCSFDNGRSLGMIPGVDVFHIVDARTAEVPERT